MYFEISVIFGMNFESEISRVVCIRQKLYDLAYLSNGKILILMLAIL